MGLDKTWPTDTCMGPTVGPTGLGGEHQLAYDPVQNLGLKNGTSCMWTMAASTISTHLKIEF